MYKDVSYHTSAVAYNEGLAETAESLVEKVDHPEIKRWCAAVGKQHRFHAKRHQAALDRLTAVEQASANGTEPHVDKEEKDLVEEQTDLTTESESQEVSA